jgi:Barrel-sandwich domain of CusB or HlyD membrane-fusion
MRRILHAGVLGVYLHGAAAQQSAPSKAGLFGDARPASKRPIGHMKSLDHSLEPDSKLLLSAPLHTEHAQHAEHAAQHTASTLLVMQSRALSHGDFKAAAVSALNDLALLLHCERVSLGLCARERVSVRAISGVLDLRAEQAAVQALAQAMEEAVEQRSALVFPAAADTTSAGVSLLHANLSQLSGGMAICTVPVFENAVKGTRTKAVLLFERQAPFDAATQQTAQDAATFLGPVLVLAQRAEASLQQRVQTQISTRSGLSPWQVGCMAAALFLAVLAIWPTTYRVVAQARAEGAVQRVIAAPADGFVRSVAVRPGEAVRADDVLVQLEDQDLKLEREKWQSEIAQLDKQYREAMSKDDAAQIVVAGSKLEQARSQLALAQVQLARSALKAPFDGVLISGDLSQSIGMPVKRGQELMTVATDRSFRIVAEVDEQDIGALAVGQTAQVLFATLSEPVPFTVSRISPVANAVEGRNVFEVEGRRSDAAAQDGSSDSLRPGLRGVAKIDIAASHVGVVWWRRASTWLRALVWRISG